MNPNILGRSAEIAFGEYNDQQFIDLKDYKINPERASYGWASNNSIYAELGMDYSKVTEKIIQNGEPGFAWLENMQKYSRMCDPVDNKDYRALGGNPCLE
jgi:ribonucleoside-triphosphate reductase